MKAARFAKRQGQIRKNRLSKGREPRTKPGSKLRGGTAFPVVSSFKEPALCFVTCCTRTTIPAVGNKCQGTLTAREPPDVYVRLQPNRSKKGARDLIAAPNRPSHPEPLDRQGVPDYRRSPIPSALRQTQAPQTR